MGARSPEETRATWNIVPTIPLSAGPAAIQALTGKLRKRAGLALYSAGLRGVQVLQTRLIPAAVPQPSDRGLYKAGWRCEPHRAGDTVDGCDIFNVEAHAALIEKGVRGANVKPGRLMINALAQWARRKGLKGAEDPKQARAIAFAIANRMKQRGIFNGGQGFHLLAKLMTAHMPGLIREEMAHVLIDASGGK